MERLPRRGGGDDRAHEHARGALDNVEAEDKLWARIRTLSVAVQSLEKRLER
jgi:hypothetical protein